MITATEKKRIVKYLGKHFSTKIKPELERLGIKNTKGEEVTNRVIQNVVKGETENFEIEQAIINLVDKFKKQRQKLQRQKKSKLK